MGKEKLFSASTLPQAVLEAASHFGIAPEELSYQRVDRRHGGLKASRRVVLAVDPEAPRRPVVAADDPASASEGSAAPPPASPPPAAEKAPKGERAARIPAAVAGQESSPPAPAVAPAGDIEELAYEALQTLLELAQVRLDARVEWGEEGLDVELFGPDEELASRRHGELLRSLEQLLPRMLREEGAAPPCRVDCQGYWERREEELRRLALEAAEQLRQEHRSQLLPPLNPSERRLVHLALRDLPDVQTESEGSGFLKRVRVESSDE